MEELFNIAYIDGQNLHMGTKSSENPWKVDLARFRIYLAKKYSIKRAYYYLGYVQEEHQNIYEKIQEAGFILVFRQHNPAMIGTKKGNVDSDIIFDAMKRLYLQQKINNIFLISGDGDYKILVDFLIKENKFGKILFPNKKFASSLYKKIGDRYYDHLDKTDIRKKIN